MGSRGDSAWMTKCTQNTFGTFSTPSFGGVGEKYEDPGTKLDPRAKGNQFTTNRQRLGQTGDNWNVKHGRRQGVNRLYEGEVYQDPHTYERKWKMEQKKKNLTSEGFRYSSPATKSSGIGGTYGMINPKFVHEPHFEVTKKGEMPAPHVPALKQVVTSPSKRGYGSSTPGTLFGPGPRKGETAKTGKEYEHSPDPYDLARQFERAERKYNVEKLAGRPAYKAMSHSLDFFDGHKTVAAPKSLTEDPIIPERPAPAAAPTDPKAAPFYPSAGPRSGPLGTFSKFPEYLEDPLEEKMKAARAAAEAAKLPGGAFKPTSGGKTSPVKTILFHEPGREFAP